jgi:hypothetical protein
VDGIQPGCDDLHGVGNRDANALGTVIKSHYSHRILDFRCTILDCGFVMPANVRIIFTSVNNPTSNLISKIVHLKSIHYFAPMQFKDIIGQEAIKQRLITSVNENRVSHAQLFLGPEGAGGLALAVAYAQYLSCEDKQPDDSCGVCSSCRKYQKLMHPDLHFSYPFSPSIRMIPLLLY